MALPWSYRFEYIRFQRKSSMCCCAATTTAWFYPQLMLWHGGIRCNSDTYYCTVLVWMCQATVPPQSHCHYMCVLSFHGEQAALFGPTRRLYYCHHHNFACPCAATPLSSVMALSAACVLWCGGIVSLLTRPAQSSARLIVPIKRPNRPILLSLCVLSYAMKADLSLLSVAHVTVCWP